ncbi:FUSC family protein [Acidicapsa dinghuensis]|uniref:FUSC family protein n=1 Tax=Acidicapsa dinghuensis TaxID=2218256 RepID=A0ABW1EFH3_9BACT|nr:FUSC family protein [Acidicapsa dinghuensis]
MPSRASIWAERIRLDLQPTEGRLSASLRITLASLITLILLMVWQVPFASVALFFIFIIGRDNPSISLRSGIMSLITLMLAVATELTLVAITDNDPAARVLGVIVVSFIAGTFVASTTLPTLGSMWGFIFCTLIALWERRAPANPLVKTSLWILAATGIAVGSSVAIEYIFAARNPAQQLIAERRNRYRALARMFSLYAEGADAKRIGDAVMSVSRLAVAGQSGMQRLYNTVVDRNLDVGDLPIGTRVRITMLAQLMDVASAFGLQYATVDDPVTRERCAQIAKECEALLDDRVPQHEGYRTPGFGETETLLDRVEGNLHIIASMPHDFSSARDKNLVALPSAKVPLFIPGAFHNKQTWYFGLKISLCATLCYLFYWGVDWPGISTSVTTVLIAGLSSTGALKQRFLFRFAGALIGGLILGLGSAIFLFPYMDSITSLVVLVGCIAFASAWIAGGRQFGYVGWQIAFSFYLVAFEDFQPPTELAPPRDRLIGILVALIVMWFVFDQMWPVRTVTIMRRAFASILQEESRLFQMELEALPHERLIQQTDVLRDHIGKTMASIRSMNDAVEYDFGVDRERHMREAQSILGAALTAVSLLWNELSELRRGDKEFIHNPEMIRMRQGMQHDLDAFAASVEQKAKLQDPAFPFMAACEGPCADLIADPHHGEYTQHTIDRFRELQTAVLYLETQE